MRTVQFSDPTGYQRRAGWTDDATTTSDQTSDLDSASILAPTEPANIGYHAGSYTDQREERNRDRDKSFGGSFVATPDVVEGELEGVGTLENPVVAR